jgi:phosphoenolpyruvate-protein kinase (PTS system EI component)
MKNLNLIFAIPTLMGASLFFTSCSTPAEKVKDAKENVTEAKNELKDANEAYLADVESYRREAAEKIEANNQAIIEFNKRVQNEKMEARADYKKKIAELEKKNTDMKKRMDDYTADGKDNWESFKMEFNRDMESLGLAFKNLTVNNVK